MNFKYDPVSQEKINDILESYKDQSVLEYMKDLWNLIDYQKKLIDKQEKQLISLKHIEAWKHYDKPIEAYDPLKLRNKYDK